ncbi:hypothetical protein BGX38DRAFT_67330 [Terfezia claveryi]|nr:hypothetical protein BGX38DRAFT_67330 [Terfezia claveryi]
MTDHWFFSQALRIKNYILYGHSLLLEPPVSTAPPVIYQSSPNCSHTVICLLGSVSSALPLHHSNILHLHRHLPPPMVCHSFSGIPDRPPKYCLHSVRHRASAHQERFIWRPCLPDAILRLRGVRRTCLLLLASR